MSFSLARLPDAHLMSDDLYASLEATFSQEGVDAGLARLAEEMRQQGQHHELFDVRLMQARRRLGIPVARQSNLDQLPEPLRTQIENAYLDACREVGQMLLDGGRIREAWMYLRPVGDKAPMASYLQQHKPDEESLQEFIELAVHEGLAPRAGFEQVLDNYGVCNAITMFDGAMHQQPVPQRAEVAELLVRRLHNDLLRNLQAEITKQEGTPPRETSIAQLVADRDWLFLNENYHIDTSHLHAVVRFARYISDPAVVRLAWELTEYGRRLSQQYQYAGEAPFESPHVSHGLFFAAQLGQQVDEAVAYFRQQAQAALDEHEGAFPVEVLIVLLQRLGRGVEALEAWATLLGPGMQPSGFAPSGHDLAAACGGFGRLKQLCQERGDVLGFAAALAAASE